MICGKCGKTIPDGAIFCCWCGGRCAEKVCATCGTELRGDQLFCHECGVRWEGEISQAVKQPEKVKQPKKQSVEQSAALPKEHAPVKQMEQKTADGKHANKMTFFRKWKIGSNDLDLTVYVDGKELGNIGAGESLTTDIFSNSVWVEVRYLGYSASMLRQRMLLSVDDNPEITFSLNFTCDISITVSRARILRQEKLETKGRFD